MQLPTHNELLPIAETALAACSFKQTVITPLGSWNTPVFRIDTTTGSCALRLHHPGSCSEAYLRGELAFLKHLTFCELAVPVPVATLSGEFLLRLEEGSTPRYCDVTTWLEGKVCRQLEPTDAYRLGLLLARIHLAARILDLPADAELPRYTAASHLPKIFSRSPELLRAWFSEDDLAVIYEVTLQAQAVFAQLAHEEGEVGTIHNDFILGNCLWHGDDVRVLDFADCGVGPYLYDLAPMLTNFSDEN